MKIENYYLNANTYCQSSTKHIDNYFKLVNFCITITNIVEKNTKLRSHKINGYSFFF